VGVGQCWSPCCNTSPKRRAENFGKSHFINYTLYFGVILAVNRLHATFQRRALIEEMLEAASADPDRALVGAEKGSLGTICFVDQGIQSTAMRREPDVQGSGRTAASGGLGHSWMRPLTAR
jgi:hypothetical protein